ncbi:hypothetical protein SADUNF_Sadunf10G0183900 [Salix dunnii]|uniref:60S acidic ribosomal protein P2 n=1 Tax=Salix dunnii TaxID=1413687 RepID=A0A835MZ73_9ROSI|nr:hypothetical protein SADUNF_Sadunf10G0183900 [Salix dunnii]
MKTVAAFLLAVLGVNNSPPAEDIKKILASVGAEADDDRIELLLSQVKSKDIPELIAAGREKLASVPCGVAVAAAAPAAGAAAPAAETKEEKVEEKEDTDDDLGFSLFD